MGRPTVKYYMQRYRRDDIWQQHNDENIDIRHVTFQYKEEFKSYINNRSAIENMLKGGAIECQGSECQEFECQGY